MNDLAITFAKPADLPHLLAVWESAVRATHDFLPASEIERLRPLVRDALANFGPLEVLRDVHGMPYAFMGVEGDSIEMLFVHADRRGNGAGRRLVEHALETYHVRRVDVNEQNALGLGFYRRFGFRPVARSP